MNHKIKLLEIYSQCIENQGRFEHSFEKNIEASLSIIASNIERQKGVFTVLITLGIHKSLFPDQDIRFHQDNMPDGFSGRSIDTRFITPVLKELGLPSMSESGWLTRSLEQPYPYTKDYNGKIGKPEVKNSFLRVVDYINSSGDELNVTEFIVNELIKVREKNKIVIEPISSPDKLTIAEFITVITEYMYETYTISGGSKIPVIVFYAIYEILITELKRFENSELKSLGYHTTSDRTSKASGDIEVIKNKNLFEALEIKFNIDIDLHMVNRAIEKIHIYNPNRYYILSTSGIKMEDYDNIITKIEDLKKNHGCQLIVNGLIPSLNYYLRLVDDPSETLEKFTNILLNDKEIKIEHKVKWKEKYEENFRY